MPSPLAVPGVIFDRARSGIYSRVLIEHMPSSLAVPGIIFDQIFDRVLIEQDSVYYQISIKYLIGF